MKPSPHTTRTKELCWRVVFPEAQGSQSDDARLEMDANGKKLLQNQGVGDFEKIAPLIVNGSHKEAILKSVMAGNKTPRQFLVKVECLCDQPDEASRDELEVVDGAVLDPHSFPCAGNDGTYYEKIWALRDIPEHRRMEESLRKSEALFRTISEASPLGIILTDENANTIYVNKAQQRICGLTSEELVGSARWEMVHPEDRERVIQEWKEIIRTQKSFRSERRYVHKDGKIVWAVLTAAPIKEEAACGYVGIVEDITERRRLDEQALRTQRMESIGTLASGVAHDLNNILAPIMMSVDLLRGEIPPDVRKGMLTTIAECAARGADIVGQVLTFARGSKGERSVLQLGHLVREEEKIARETFPKSIGVVNHVPRDLWPVNGDSSQLHQVVMNLCINARDAMAAGGTLTITGENIKLDENHLYIHPDAKPGPYTVLKVMDTGEGIPQEIIDKIFDPFFTTKEVGKGTGLGLSTVIGIVRSHGGFVNVYSEIGKGSTFKVYLPAAMSGKAEGALKEQPVIQGGAGETILVVDDEPAILTMTGAMLRKHGYRVFTASSGVEAISLYVQHSAVIKAVITDVMMPLMDGVNLIRALKKMNPHLKVISTTGQAEESRQAELRVLGVKVFLQKPHATRKLLTAMHDLIHSENTGGER